MAALGAVPVASTMFAIVATLLSWGGKGRGLREGAGFWVAWSWIVVALTWVVWFAVQANFPERVPV